MSDLIAGRETSRSFPEARKQSKSTASIAGPNCVHLEVTSGAWRRCVHWQKRSSYDPESEIWNVTWSCYVKTSGRPILHPIATIMIIIENKRERKGDDATIHNAAPDAGCRCRRM